jgi:enoyl-CoA hydratase/carnithine racemase
MADTWISLKQWDELILERLDDAGVARVTLNRPDKRNALTGGMLEAFQEALEIVRADKDLKAVVTRGAGKVYSSGMDLHYLRTQELDQPKDWDRPTVNIRVTEAIRQFPRILIAQVHGYCLGGSLAFMNAHDLVIAANDAQLGMPEITRGSFGQIATSTLYHAQIPIKKAALIAIVGENITGEEADRLGLVSLAVPAEALEARTTELARQISTRALSALQHGKIAAQMGRDMSLSDAIKLDQLLGIRQRLGVDPTGHVDGYLESQKGGTNTGYKRPDVG